VINQKKKGGGGCKCEESVRGGRKKEKEGDLSYQHKREFEGKEGKGKGVLQFLNPKKSERGKNFSPERKKRGRGDQ